MGPTLTHRISSGLEWTFGVGAAAVSFPYQALTPFFAQADATGAANGWNNTLLILTVASGILVTKILEFIKGYRQVNHDSDHGKWVECQAECAREKAEKARIEAEHGKELRRVGDEHGREVTRMVAEHAGMLDRADRAHTQAVKDYEERLKHKRDEIEYLHTLLAAARDGEEKQRKHISVMELQLFQSGEVMLEVNRKLADAAHQSVSNTAEVIQELKTSRAAADTAKLEAAIVSSQRVAEAGAARDAATTIHIDNAAVTVTGTTPDPDAVATGVAS